MNRLFSFTLWVSLMLTGMWHPAHSETLNAHVTSLEQLADVEVLEDATGELTLEDIQRPNEAAHFKPWSKSRGQINLGFTTSAYWFRFTLMKAQDAPANWVLQIPFFQLRTVDFYAPGKAPVQTGSSRPLSNRPYLNRFFAFPLEVGDEPRHYYLRVTSDHSMTVPLTLWQEHAFRHNVQGTLILQALYFGGLIALLLYNLFLALSLRDLRFLLYSVFASCMGMGMFAGNGFGQMFLWQDYGEFDGIAQSFFFTLSGVAALLFANRFLNAAQLFPRLSRVLNVLAAFYFVVALGLITHSWHGLPYQWFVMILFILTFPAGALVAVAGIQGLRHRQKGTRFFVLAWIVLWAGASIATLRAFDVLSTNVFTAYSLQISSAIEMLLLAFALADLVHLERQSREVAQREALASNQRLLVIARTAEERLEREVQQRTEQLEQALSLETQLSEKYMRFGALISHEFRNPLGIVQSQVSLIRKEHERGQLNLNKRLDTIGSAIKRLLSLFDTWLQGDRLQQTLMHMKPARIDLSLWLRNITDAQAAYHEEHPIQLRLTPPVGELWADESLLSIALINLIDNACKYSTAGQAVVIENRHKPGWIGIAVTDEGCGIDSSNHAAIFDDYYRVSPESTIAGLGLGLAFVRRIVTMHQGELELNSAQGQGSSFCIWLPLPST